MLWLVERDSVCPRIHRPAGFLKFNKDCQEGRWVRSSRTVKQTSAAIWEVLSRVEARIQRCVPA